MTGKPFCAICQKPVDKIVTWEDYDRLRINFRVECHGDEDNGWVDLFDVRIASAKQILDLSKQTAFRTKRLCPAPNP